MWVEREWPQRPQLLSFVIPALFGERYSIGATLEEAAAAAVSGGGGAGLPLLGQLSHLPNAQLVSAALMVRGLCLLSFNGLVLSSGGQQ